jgi:rhamnose transport system ATP-binding protein
VIDHRRSRELVSQAMHDLGVDMDPDRLTAELSAAECQFVAIVRALMVESQLLIFDEPTSALTAGETERLFSVIRTVAARGTSVLLISHRLEEVRSIADRVSVLRDGRRVASLVMGEVSDEEIVRLMLGQEFSERLEERGHAKHVKGDLFLKVVGLSSGRRFHDITFEVCSGEVLVLAGLVGSGRSEVLETIMGLRHEDGGVVSVQGKAVLRRSPRRMLDLGIDLVPEDRDREGLVRGFGVRENIVLPIMGKLGRLGFLNGSRERSVAQERVSALNIKAASLESDVASLSGGNRQKVVVAKWLAAKPKLLILDEPTRGVDVGAKFEIHRIIRSLVSEGNLGVLVVSSDLPEVVDLADRVLVMRSGTIVAEFRQGEITEERILTAATGSLGTSGAQHEC